MSTRDGDVPLRGSIAPRVLESPPGPEVTIDGRRYLYFGGTGYLGLQSRPDVQAAASAAVFRFGVGSATSRAAYGTTPPVVEVERLMADWFRADDAIYLPSGYATNRVLLEAIAEHFDRFWIDEAAHGSLFDALAGWPHPVHRFAHRNVDDLESQLADNLQAAKRPLVLTDGVFAVRGTMAPIGQYAAILAQYPGGGLFVDDAHGLGVLGPSGRGSFEAVGLDVGVVNRSTQGETASAQLFWTATLSKACGGFGGVVPGGQSLVDAIRKRSNYYAGATPVPTPVAAASACGLRIAIEEAALRERLHANALHLKRGLRGLGLDIERSPVPIAGFSLATGEAMRRLQERLADRGIMIAYFERYAGLPPEGGLRIAVFADHTSAMIDRLLDELKSLL